MWRPWSESEVREVFTTESRQKSQRLFSQTHQPFSRIMVSHNRLGFGNGAFISEGDLLELVLKSRPRESSRIFMVVGETGSGKSELCQWLEYTLPSSHRPIHVSRSRASLNGVIDVLLGHSRGVNIGKGNLPPTDALVDHVYASLRLTAYRSGKTEWVRFIESIRPWVLEACIHLTETGELLGARGRFGGFLQCPSVDTLDAWLLASLRESLGIRSLAPLLRSIVTACADTGQRPVLLLEDITSIGFLRDDLLDFVFDLSEPGFDVVLGLTSGYETANLTPGGFLHDMAYVRDRVEARFQLSNSSGETFFLNSPESLCRIVQGYLSCLPPRPNPRGFGGLYPFTETALERIYNHLVESGTRRQTPRILLDAVIRPLLSQVEPPYRALMKPSSYLQSPSVVFRHDGLSDDEVGLLYWYGVRREGVYRVDSTVSLQFGMRTTIEAEAYELPSPADSGPRGRQADGERREEWEEAFRQLRDWRQSGDGKPFGKRHLLKKGLQRLIDAVYEPRLVVHPHGACNEAGPLRYHRGGSRLPLHLEDSGDASTPGGVPVMRIPRDEPPAFYEELLTHAFGATDSTQGFTDIAGTIETVGVLMGRFQAEIRDYLKRVLGMPVEHFCFGAWWYSQQLGHGFTETELLDARRLLDYRMPPDSGVSVWDEKEHRVLARTHSEITGMRTAYRKLFASMFHVRDGFVDPERIEEETHSFSPEEWADQLGSVDLRKLRKAPFRQDGTGLSLYELARPMVEYVRAQSAYPQTAADGDALALSDYLRTIEYYLAVANEKPSIAVRLEQSLAALRGLGWLQIPVVDPPPLDLSHSDELAKRARLVLATLSPAARTAGREARFWWTRLRSLPIVSWDAKIRLLTLDLRDAVSAEYMSRSCEMQDQVGAESRVAATLTTLLKATQ